jgi:hypothetical protein
MISLFLSESCVSWGSASLVSVSTYCLSDQYWYPYLYQVHVPLAFSSLRRLFLGLNNRGRFLVSFRRLCLLRWKSRRTGYGICFCYDVASVASTLA